MKSYDGEMHAIFVDKTANVQTNMILPHVKFHSIISIHSIEHQAYCLSMSDFLYVITIIHTELVSISTKDLIILVLRNICSILIVNNSIKSFVLQFCDGKGYLCC